MNILAFARQLPPILERILLTLWIGGLWVVGLVVAPALFTELADPATAGTLAGALFSRMSWIGLVCAVLLLLLGRLQHAAQALRWRPLVLLAMLALVAVGEFLLAPQIADLRQQGLAGSARFTQLHGLAGAVYVINCLLGLLLVAAGRSRRPAS
jgi:uncharacterized membrane protein